MIEQNSYFAVVRSKVAKDFAAEVVSLEDGGWAPVMGQAFFFSGGEHVAYYARAASPVEGGSPSVGEVVEEVPARVVERDLDAATAYG